MSRSYGSREITLIIAGLLFLVGLAVTATADDLIPTGSQTLTAPQLHQILAESKASQLADRSLARKLMPANKAASTQTNYDVKFYDIDLRIDENTELIYGAVKIVVAAAEDGVTAVQIDLFDDMTVDSIVSPSGMMPYSRASNVITVTLDRSYDSGEEFSCTIYYYGHPTEGGFQAFLFDTRSGSDIISSLSEPYFARTWWPCKDRPDDKADSFNIALTGNSDYYIASNGTLDSIVDIANQTHTFYYRVRYPMTSYLFSVAISDYTVWYDQWVYNGGADTMPIVNAVFSDLYVSSLTQLDITPGAIQIFSDAFGEYPFANEKYGHANFTWGGAMEHQTMTSTTDASYGFSTNFVTHELAHQWWGDMITCASWPHIWLNEGWASYSEALYYEALSGWNGYHNHMNTMQYPYGGSIYIYDTTDVWNIFSTIVYDKGAWVVHMLRGVLGDEAFFQAVSDYYNSPYQHGSATTEQFRDVFEASSGRDLDWFFEDWIYGTYRPSYHYSYWQEPSDTGGYDVFLYVDQRQATPPLVFRMPVDFSFGGYVGDQDTLTLFVDQREMVFKLNFDHLLDTVKLDPAGWVLKYVANDPWGMHVVSSSDDLSQGHQYENYLDTIETRGAGTTTTKITGGALPSGYIIDSSAIISWSYLGYRMVQFHRSDSGYYHQPVRLCYP